MCLGKLLQGIATLILSVVLIVLGLLILLVGLYNFGTLAQDYAPMLGIDPDQVHPLDPEPFLSRLPESIQPAARAAHEWLAERLTIKRFEWDGILFPNPLTEEQ